MATGPLDGFTVLELTQGIGGAFGGMHLADLGATVLKVEPPDGDAFRREASVTPGTSKRFQWLNRGKRSIVVDLARPEARTVVHDLIRTVDVVVVSGYANDLEAQGLDYPTLAAVRPNLVYMHMTGWGPDGEFAGEPATDTIAQAYCGGLAQEGSIDDDGAPAPLRFPPVPEMTSGLAIGLGACAALFHRELTGEGQLVEGSLIRSAMSVMGTYIMRETTWDAVMRDGIISRMAEARAQGQTYKQVLGARSRGVPSAMGLPGSPHHLYYGSYVAKDGAIAFGALTPPNRTAMRGVLGIPDEGGDDPEFNAIDPDNIARMVEIKKEIQGIVRERSVGDWIEGFREAGAPVAPVNLPEELADASHMSSFMVDVDDPITGPQRQIGPMLWMHGTPGEVHAAPVLDAHTDEVLRAAGYSDERIAELRAAGVVGRRD